MFFAPLLPPADPAASDFEQDNFGLEQGDLLENVPFTYVGLSQATVIGLNGKPAVRDLPSVAEATPFVVAALEHSWGIVITQTCDLQPNPKTGEHEDPIVIARVKPIAEIVSIWDDSTPKKALASVNSLSTEAKAPNTFYLPPFSSDAVTLPRMGVDILDVQRFGGGNMAALCRLFRLRLSGTAQQAFQSRVAYCFGRFAAPDDFYLSTEDQTEKERQAQEKSRNQPR